MQTEASPGIFRGEQIHLPFIGLALGLALLGGLVLAVVLPVMAATGGPGATWVALAQVHGHLQAVGFVGLFILGVAHRMGPRFAGRPLPFPSLVVPAFWLIGVGVLARALAQPLADAPVWAAVLVVGAWAEAAGAACFAANAVPLGVQGVRRREEFGPFFAAGAAWLVLQALLGAVWLSDLALDGGRVLPGDRNAVLLLMQIFGFQLSFLFAVGLRSFPTFFGAGRLTFPPAAGGAALFQGGLVLAVAASLLTIGGTRAWVAADLGSVAMALGVVWLAGLARWWRLPTRLRPASKPFAWTLQPAMAWLVLAALLLAGFGVDAAVRGAPIRAGDADAVRHIVEVGVILLAIVGMAQMVLPEFAAERLRGPQARWRSVAFGVTLSAAVVLRAGARLASPPLSDEAVYWLMAVAGLLALGAIAAFAFLVGRSVWRHRATLAQMTMPLSEVRRSGAR